jgi:hypothetical protein
MNLTKKIALLVFINIISFNCHSKIDPNKNITVLIDNGTLNTFKDVQFTLDHTEKSNPTLFFSTVLGKTFRAKEIDQTILPKIDIALYSPEKSLTFFTSPNDKEYGIKDATLSFFLNNVKNQLTIDQFNKIEKASDFDHLKIDTDDDDSFTDEKTPKIVLFKNAAGKKGAIYIKSIHRDGYNSIILVDIKIQK